MPQIESSFIKSLEYDVERQEAICEFRDGKTFGYSPMTQKEFDDWVNAESAGKFFHAHIKKNGRFTVRAL